MNTSRINKLGVGTKYVKIYDHVYSRFAKEKSYEPSNAYKIEIISTIFNNMDMRHSMAIEAYVRYKDFKKAAKILNCSPKLFSNVYDTAMRRMYSPQNIATAVLNYYEVQGQETLLKDSDFGGRKYIITALDKAGLYSKERLMKHLTNGYYYLWTIPGCGDVARQRILMTVDAWDIHSKIYLKKLIESIEPYYSAKTGKYTMGLNQTKELVKGIAEIRKEYYYNDINIETEEGEN